MIRFLLLLCLFFPLAAQAQDMGTRATGSSGASGTASITGGTINGATIGGTTPAPVTGTTINGTSAVQVNGVALLPILSGTTGSIGGGALLAGACTSGTVNITGATSSMVAETDPNTYPGDGAVWDAQVTSNGVVTVKVCAIIALTPGASTYNVRVFQ